MTDIPTPAAALRHARALLSPRARAGLDALPAAERDTTAHAVATGAHLETWQWLIPLCEGRGAPETAEGLQDAKHYDTEIRSLAAAALRSPAALDLVTRWNAVTTPHEGPIRYLTRWTTAPAT